MTSKLCTSTPKRKHSSWLLKKLTLMKSSVEATPVLEDSFPGLQSLPQSLLPGIGWQVCHLLITANFSGLPMDFRMSLKRSIQSRSILSTDGTISGKPWQRTQSKYSTRAMAKSGRSPQSLTLKRVLNRTTTGTHQLPAPFLTTLATLMTPMRENFSLSWCTSMHHSIM